MARRALLVTLLIAAAPAPAGAAYPGENGGILYRGARDGASVLYLRHGHTVAPVPVDATGLRDATFSPRGRRVAFARGGSLWVMNADTGDQRTVTAPGVDAVQPSWSPDGAQLAFTRREKGRRRIQVVVADGTGLRDLTSGGRGQFDPAWSVTNSVAFVMRTARGTAIATVPAAGGPPARLTSTRVRDSAPAWSPDGSSIAFVRAGQGVWVMAADGSGRRRVANLRGVGERAPAWAPDGERILFSAGKPGARRIWSVRPDGGGRSPVSTPSSDGREPDWEPAGSAPVVMAAGDVACDPASPNYNNGQGFTSECAQLRTSNLLARADLDGILVLGDAQYTQGTLEQFTTVFDPTWGRFRSLLHPAPGNHEYRADGGATGYFRYFNGETFTSGPAGDPSLGYYSFDIGDWHIISLNSNCSRTPGKCAAGSPQEQWLRADLASHPAACTLAYWHNPPFSSAGTNANMAPIFAALYESGADVVLAGHHHLYERFAPLDPAGNVDPARGVREFIVGTGGKSLVGTTNRRPGSEAIDASTYGVLELTLGDGGYAWRFVGAGPGSFTDGGLATCH
jgi:dipeptidyl aminopeptidase/acylaminoacyl peptidase